MFSKISLCFLVFVASATAVSISGLASLDANAVEAQGKLTFPRIPGINVPSYSTPEPTVNDEFTEDADISMFTRLINDSRPAQFFFPGHNKIAYSFGNLANIIPVPNITALLLSRNITNATNVIVLPLSPLPSIHKFFPGLDFAVYHARKHLAQALNTPGDVTLGIQNALQRAFMSSDPAAAINTLIQTILSVYGSAIRNCPFIFMGTKLATEAANLVQSVITAIMTATVIP